MQRILLACLVLALPATVHAQDVAMAKILVPNEGWRVVAKDLPDVTYLEATPTGELAIYQGTLAARLQRDGTLQPATDKSNKVLRGYGTVKTALSSYHINRQARGIYTTINGKRVDLAMPVSLNSLAVWPDEGQLIVGAAEGGWMWAVRLEKDGSFGPGDRYYSLRTAPGERAYVSGMVMDSSYLLYACTPFGIQVFDPTGRLSAVIATPASGVATAITIGGPDGNTLYIASGDRIYARRIQGKAAYAGKN